MTLELANKRVHSILGLSNFRDAGGYQTRSGQIVKRGRLFRSAHPGLLTDEGLRELSAFGIGYIIDLRGVHESAETPMPSLVGTGMTRVPAHVEPSTSSAIRELVAQGRINGSALRDVMIASYRGYVRDKSPTFAAALAVLIDGIDKPVLVHCTAGKDRTGFLIAMIQAALGVAHEDILADYLLTNHTWDQASPIPQGLDEASYQSIRVASAEYLASAFDEIETIHGSMTSYQEDVLGIDHFKRRRLESCLLE